MFGGRYIMMASRGRKYMKIWFGVWGFLTFGLFCAAVRGADRAVLTATDFNSGSLAVVDLVTFEATANLLNIHSDAVVRTYRNRVYVVNRLGQDNVLVLDGSDLSSPALQFSVGNGTNPQDIVFASETKAYVARLEAVSVLVVNPATGDSIGSIDLSFVADEDGFPEAAHLAIYEGRLYVTCQRLNQNAFFAPTDRSEVVVVDVNTDRVVDLNAAQAGVQTIVLEAKNPLAQVQVKDKLYLSCVGSFSDLADGGVEVVDLKGMRTEGVAIGESDLGGNVGSVAMATGNRGYAVVTDASFANSVKGFDLAAKRVSDPLPGTSGGFTPALGALKGRLYVSDQGNPEGVGLRVYDTAADTLVAGPISTGLPPNAIAFLVEAGAADFDGDGDVDFDDFVQFAAAFGKKAGEAGHNVKFDLDGDGRVRLSDFVLFVQAYSEHNP